jgi:hypothetical protein
VNIYELVTPVMRHFRVRRMAAFAKIFALTSSTRVLDVGGTPFNWLLSPVRPRVTLLNNEAEPVDRSAIPADMEYVVGDARRLPFASSSFDIVYSNSVIEHVGDFVTQREFSSEIARVGRKFYVQTPHRYFPVEPHLMTPLVHWLPRSVQGGLLPYATVWGWSHRLHERRWADEAACAWYRDVRLLTAPELAELFPSARVVREQVGGLTKSLIAMHV